MADRITGGEQKLASAVSIKFEAFSDASYSGKSTSSWEGDYLPKELPLSFKNVFANKAELGQSSAESTFERSEPINLKFELEIQKPILLDQAAMNLKNRLRTGRAPSNDDDDYVMKRIKSLNDLVFKYNGKIHAPNYVLVSFGKLIFKGRCSVLNYTLKRFDRNGVPSGATISLMFNKEQSKVETKKREDSQSPDMTHYYTVSHGETLPLISNKIYGTTDLYLELAKFNKLNSFRSLKAGTKLIIPPLNK